MTIEPTEAALLDDLQTSVSELLSTISNLTPFVELLVDTRQRGLGFMTYEAKEAQSGLHRKERRAAAQRRKDGYVLGPGESPVPGNVAGLSVYADLHATLHHLARHLINAQARVGICTMTRIPSEPSVDQLVAALRELTWQSASMFALEGVRRDLEVLRDESLRLIDGNDRTVLGADCPHCKNRTLVVYFKDELIRCDRDPKTGRYEPCTCAESICECKSRPRDFRHEWHLSKGTKPNGWEYLAARIGTVIRPTVKASTR